MDLPENLTQLNEMIAQLPAGILLPVLVFSLVFYLLPSILAFFFNRDNLRKIFLVNLISGLSWVAWLGTLVWAVTGKIYKPDKPSKAAMRGWVWFTALILIAGIALFYNCMLNL